MEQRRQYYFDLLDIFSDHASAQPQVSSDQMATSKATPTCTSPRRAPHKTNDLELDSSDEDKSDKNASSDDQDREEVAEALANAVGSGQAEPTLGVGSVALPIPAGEYDEYSGELGGLLDGGARNTKL